MNLIFTLLIISLVINLDAQEEWYWQNPLPQGNSLRDIQIIDDNIVYAIGHYGSIIKTTDGGNNWHLLKSNVKTTLYSMCFIDEITGWIVGGAGTILKTEDGGENWIQQDVGTEAWLRSVFFIDENIFEYLISNFSLLNDLNLFTFLLKLFLTK